MQIQKREKVKRLISILLTAGLLTGMTACQPAGTGRSVSEVMDDKVTFLYRNFQPDDLRKLDYDAVMKLFDQEERQALGTRHWSFEASVPVVVSVMRSVNQKIVPFWLPEYGFQKTGLTMKNEQTTYEVWQKKFDAGTVGLGINGFDQNLGMHYFVTVAPQNKNDRLVLSNFFPASQYVGILDDGAFTYHDWDELVLTDVPDEMKGQQLLPTVRGRAAESHLIGAFRESKFPASASPDQFHLSWSSDPSTTIDVLWRTDTSVATGQLKYRVKGTAAEQTVPAEKLRMEDRLLMNDRYVHHFTARLKGLTPGTTYEYSAGDGWAEGGAFTTAASDDVFSFLWFGDTHNSPLFGEILQLAYQTRPEVAFFSIAGDLVSDGLFRDQWDELWAYSRGVANQIPLMAVPGNHDNRAGRGAQLFRDQFSYPLNAPEGVPAEQTYAFQYKNALFLMIDATSLLEPHTAWIEKQLAESKATWKIAMFHFPPYNWEEPYLNIQEAWVPLFDKYQVDLVLGGHIHYYMRSKPMKGGKVVPEGTYGTTYMVSVGIPSREGERTPEPYAAVRNFKGHLYQYVQINGNELLSQTLDAQNHLVDSFRLKK